MPVFVPEYERVANDLRQRIRSGEFAPGSKLPSRRELAAHYDIGATTVDNAMMLLRAERLVRGHPGKGVFVADLLPPGGPAG